MWTCSWWTSLGTSSPPPSSSPGLLHHSLAPHLFVALAEPLAVSLLAWSRCCCTWACYLRWLIPDIKCTWFLLQVPCRSPRRPPGKAAAVVLAASCGFQAVGFKIKNSQMAYLAMSGLGEAVEDFRAATCRFGNELFLPVGPESFK